MEIGSKVCTKCQTMKPFSDFSPAKHGKYGLRSICRVCKNIESVEYRAKNKEKYREKQKQQREKKRFTLEQRAKYIQKTYGVSLDWYIYTYNFQKGCCAICKKPLTLFKQSETESSNNVANVDHNHFTGFVRGLLCGDCNRALGLLQDNITAIRNAAEYLEFYKGVK